MSSFRPEKNVHRITLYNTVAAAHQHRSNRPRLYLHLDMNCFYAQVEQHSFNLYGVPVIVGGWRKPDGVLRGIVATSSYEARKLGIKTAMSAWEAQQICPYIVCLQIHYEKYQSISREINRYLKTLSPDVEGYSMDEYFVDVSHWLLLSETEIRWRAMRVKDELYRLTGLLCSIGVARSKTYAKLASDLVKPNGFTGLFSDEDEAQIVHPLSVSEVWGIGQKRTVLLKSRGILTISDVLRRGSVPLQQLFGDYFGKMLFETISGHDQARVMNAEEYIPKEVSYMHTFPEFTTDIDKVLAEMAKAVRQLAYRMRGYGRKARIFACQFRFEAAAWKGVSFEFRTPGFTNLDEYILQPCEKRARPLLQKLIVEGHQLRGVGLSTAGMTEMRQLDLFFQQEERLEKRYLAVDQLNNRYGFDLVTPAVMHTAIKGETHFRER